MWVLPGSSPNKCQDTDSPGPTAGHLQQNCHAWRLQRTPAAQIIPCRALNQIDEYSGGPRRPTNAGGEGIGNPGQHCAKSMIAAFVAGAIMAAGLATPVLANSVQPD